MSHAELEPWKPQRNAYFQPSQTTYYETTCRENRGQGGTVARALGAVFANGLLGWGAWSAHQACLNGSAHSVAAEAVVSAAAAGSAALAGAGFLSRTEAGSWAGALLSPVALILGGVGVLLWAPKWPASLVATAMFGVLNGGLAWVVAKANREVRKTEHEAGMQYDRIAGNLQMNLDSEQHKTERARIKHQSWFHVGRDADQRADRVVYDLHLRHPDIVPAPERYSSPTELAAAPTRLAITAGREDDWMALADVLDVNVETTR
ncbi:hypothetical protein Caci_2875 [Catenulispora acidiphila DSM 44928]|uniref:Uncharacterized protein n=1 Tax=Catenulispora acidiphila (strain DSM 44928 / JCM 14897 / NBRC 102108 / NRRL B-24433 / ID139908) TaxID=479433 RepID=C7Q2P2_CATAD|nr:hypothetical protein [Catenulispora acidiphila]ACU71784.1 hypothetical protein Caci_2875 [Catenulispora acidiphila DSM 44928]